MKIIFIILVFLFLPVFVLAEQIDINTATLSQLDVLTGIGPAYAQRIIDGRPYSSVDDLDRVKGIGTATLQKIKSQGFACVNCLPAQAGQTTQQTIQPVAGPVAQTTAAATTPITTPIPTPATTYLGGIFINEILPNPEGADETNEWIELYNSNNNEVDLSGWKIQNTAGTTTTFTISEKVSANGFLVFKRPETKITMHNDGDGLNLLTPDGKIEDSINFPKAPLGQSYNKINSGWQWSLTLTPGAINVITIPKTSAKALSKSKDSVKNNAVEAGLADISQAIDSNQDNNIITSPWFLFFTALVTTIILASIVLIIKLRFSKKTI
jgi:competence ComEA-like helix-hairpin-helix protein